ncbi:MAG: ribosomal RNA small subunit methyltransferase A [Phycisphaerae bacterium]|nr:ribosomal RNA small subunit methyltransferase A [Phycisphaerae bacterium]
MSVEHVQTKREIQTALSGLGVRPRKRFGQRFLIDGNLMRRLVECAEITSQDTVLEVGPGTGGLTDLLARHAGRIVAVEIDRDLFTLLQDRFRDVENVTLICGDVLAGKHKIMPEVAALLGSGKGDSTADGKAMSESPVKLVANLPYQIATPLVMNLLIDFPRVRRFCFTVQAEVGDRITAGPGCRDYGPLSIVTQALTRVRTITRIGPQAFWPAPAVHSVMLQIDVLDPPFAHRGEVAAFARMVRGVFDHRRKKLRSALALALGDEGFARVREHVDENLRPEALGVAEWLEVFRRWRETAPSPAD